MIVEGLFSAQAEDMHKVIAGLTLFSGWICYFVVDRGRDANVLLGRIFRSDIWAQYCELSTKENITLT